MTQHDVRAFVVGSGRKVGSVTSCRSSATECSVGCWDHRFCPMCRSYEEARSSEPGTVAVDYLRREIPYLWQDAYFEMTPRPTGIVVFTQGSFDYVYDDYATLEATGGVVPDGVSEARLVGAIGISQPTDRKRRHDDGRLRGWIGPTNVTFGDDWDQRTLHRTFNRRRGRWVLRRMFSCSGAQSTAAATVKWRDTALLIPACCVLAGPSIAILRPGPNKLNSVW